MEIAELLKLLTARGDVLGLVLAAAFGLLALYLKYRTSDGSSAADDADGEDRLRNVASQIKGIDQRLSRVESDIEHLPTRHEFHQMELGMVRLDERVSGIEETTKSTGRAVVRIEDFLISLSKKG